MGEWAHGHCLRPHRSGSRGLQGAAQMPEQAGVWTGGGEREPNAACGLDDASAYFQKFFARGRELSDSQRMSFGDIVTQIEH